MDSKKMTPGAYISLNFKSIFILLFTTALFAGLLLFMHTLADNNIYIASQYHIYYKWLVYFLISFGTIYMFYIILPDDAPNDKTYYGMMPVYAIIIWSMIYISLETIKKETISTYQDLFLVFLPIVYTSLPLIYLLSKGE